MKCLKCSNQAVNMDPVLCKNHFIEYFENKVLKTIKKFDLIKDEHEKIVVAVSGGKDSMALLYLLHKFKYNVEALAIDEGIKDYRDKSLEFLKEFCENNKIKLIIESYESEFGKTLDELSKKYVPACNVCGTFRRYLLNKYSEKYEKIATGHNLDDESQAILMNILKAQTALFSRQGFKTKEIEGFTQKIKPFYFMKEKEIMIYAVLLNLNVDFKECPYAPESFRSYVRDKLNKEEVVKPGTKLNIINHYSKLKKEMLTRESEKTKVNKFKKSSLNSFKDIRKCNICGYPCSGLICKVCKLKEDLKEDS